VPKTDNGQSASTWRRKDKAYRERERQRRRVNAVRRSEVAEAAARGVTIEQVREEKKED
jgi:hypothetical protein